MRTKPAPVTADDDDEIALRRSDRARNALEGPN